MGTVNKMIKPMPNSLKRMAYRLIPFSYRYGKVYRKTYTFLKESQWWRREKLEEYQWQQLKKLLDHAYKNVFYYRKVFNERGLKPKDIQNISDFQKLPFLTKDIVRNYQSKLIADNASSIETIWIGTSGSTGSPLEFIGERTLYQIEAAFLTRAYNSHGSKPYKEKSVWLRRYIPEAGAPFYKYNSELRRLYLSPFHLSPNTVGKYVDLINSYGARLLEAYPSSLYVLAMLMKEKGLYFKNIKIAHVSSEKLLDQWKEKIEEVLNIPVKDHYGSLERVSLFHRCGDSDFYHDNMEYGLTEIVNQKDGIGEVVGTSLTHYVMPFIRYKIGDVAKVNREDQQCSCGRGLPLAVEEFRGRSDDILITSDGSYISGIDFYTMMYHIKGIKMFKIIQHSINEVELQIVPDEKYSTKTKNVLEKGMFDCMGEINLNIHLVKEIPRSKKTGKIRCIETDIKTEERMSRKLLPAKKILELTPYKVSEGGKLNLEEKKDYLKLDWNESTFSPSPNVEKRLLGAMKDEIMNFYPDVTASELCNKLSDYLNIDISHIQVFNGSDAALRAVCITYLNHNDNVLIRQPTYQQFRVFAQCTGANLIEFTGDTPFSPALDKYHDYLSKKNIKMVYIVNPNNPTGIVYEESVIENFLKEYPKTLFIIDEAYFEYSGITAINLVRTYSNIIITRTFSKAFGLAGLRIGYILGQPQLIDDLNTIHNGKDINTFAQIAASAALDDIPYMKSRVNEVLRTKMWLVNKLKSLRIEVYESSANFILIRLPDTDKIIQDLKKERILVRDQKFLPQLNGYIRISIGLFPQMELFLDTMCKILQKKGE